MTLRSTTAGLVAVAGTVLALATAVPAAAAPDGVIRHAGGPAAVADSYIVVLRDTGDLRQRGVPALARQLADRNSGAVGYLYSAALEGFSVTMSAANARRVAADPAVEYVEQNQTVSLAATQTNPPSYGLDRIDQVSLPLNSSYTYPTTASNVRAYIIDTGIRITHNDFGGRAVSGRDTVDNDNDANDCNGHGTHVAGTTGGAAYGVAKGVQLVGVRVLNCAGSGTNAGVIAGVDWVTANAIKPAVANMSLGGGADSALDSAVRTSISSGITYAVAAGNSNANACNSSPARLAEAITVGASTRTDARASYSNFGTCVDIFAPGDQITSAWYTSNTATNTISGTSMASPHVAGAAALYLASNTSASPQQVRDNLVNTASLNKVTNPGTGSPNRLLFIGGGTTPPPTGCTAGQLLGNNGFEGSTATPWTASTGVIDSSTGQPARTGAKKAWLNGYGTTRTDTLSQTVSIPSGCGSATFSFWLRITTAETGTTAYDKLTVTAGSTTLATYSNANANATYTQKSFSLNGFVGQTVTLKFTGTEDSSLQTSFVVDDTALNVS